MNIGETIKKIRDVKTMPELDELRGLTVDAMTSGGKEAFDRVQGEFRKSKNRLTRVPLKDRTW
jgi:hypothetical protein